MSNNPSHDIDRLFSLYANARNVLIGNTLSALIPDVVQLQQLPVQLRGQWLQTVMDMATLVHAQQTRARDAITPEEAGFPSLHQLQTMSDEDRSYWMRRSAEFALSFYEHEIGAADTDETT